MNAQKQIGKIISIDIDLESFKLAEKLLKLYGLQDLVTFIRADLAVLSGMIRPYRLDHARKKKGEFEN